MNQKLLARLFYSFLVVMVIAALFLLNYQVKQNKKRDQGGNTINVVSRVDTAANDPSEQTAKPAIINVPVTDLNLRVDAKKNSSSAELTYLAIYRQLQTAKACRSIYDFWTRNGLAADVTSVVRSPLNVYGGTYYLPDEKPPLTAGQTEALKTWVLQCHRLWEQYGEFEQEPNHLIPKNDVTDAINQRLLATVAKTNKEMGIKKVRLLAAQWQQGLTQIEAVMVGEDSGNVAELQAIHNQIAQLTQLREDLRLQWLEVRSSDESQAEALNQQRIELSQQIWQLESQIQQQKVVNQEQLQQAVDVFQSHDLALNLAMRTNDGDVFYEALELYQGEQLHWIKHIGFATHSTLNDPSSQYRITPDQLVFEASGWRNHPQHGSDLSYAAQLYLCDLGWDCGANSPIVMSYCLSGIYSQPAACGQSLQEFLHNDLISPNRWQDVMVFKNLYKELYSE